MFAEEESRLLVAAARTPAELEAMVARRVVGWPVEQVVGWTSFLGLRIAVDPGVFVPRRRTELLAREAIRHAAGIRGGTPVVAELCCGVAAVSAAVSAAIGDVELYAADIDPAAVRCARRNLEGTRAEVREGDLYAGLPRAVLGRIDVLVANAPYVPSSGLATMPREARLFEPRAALDGGPDGLDVIGRIVVEAAGWLRPHGHLLLETSEPQAPATVAACLEAGLTADVTGSAELGATVVTARPMSFAAHTGQHSHTSSDARR